MIHILLVFCRRRRRSRSLHRRCCRLEMHRRRRRRRFYAFIVQQLSPVRQRFVRLHFKFKLQNSEIMDFCSMAFLSVEAARARFIPSSN